MHQIANFQQLIMKHHILKISLTFIVIFSGIFIQHAKAQVSKKVLEKNQRQDPGEIRKVKRTRRYENTYPRTTRTGSLPPGHAKKVYGEKSARDFAPGHNKSTTKYYRKDSRGKNKKHYAKHKNKR